MKMSNIKLTYLSTRTMYSITFLLICFSLFGCGNAKNVAIVSSENELSHSAPQQNDQGAPVPEKMDETLLNHHATQNSSITKNNVGSMAMSWKYSTPYPVSHAPLVDDTGVYFGDWGGTVYKVEPKTGMLIWKNKIEEPKTEWAWYGLAGTGALGDGKLFEASVEGTAFALNISTGKVLWESRFTDDPEAGSLSKLLYYGGLVYIGVQSVEEPLTAAKENFKPDFRGKVIALDGNTGAKVWERYLVDPPQNGVAVWTSFALDIELNTLFFTTGNNYTGKGSELSDAMVAVDAKTGEMKWHKQLTEHDVWTMKDKEGPDYDFGGGAQLFSSIINGKKNKLVGGAQKSGSYHVFDAQTGKEVWSTVIGYGGIDGGMHGEASLGPNGIFAWSNNKYQHKNPPADFPVSIKALDPATGRPKWVINKAQPAAIIPGFLANDVYFVGSLDGTIKAYRADDGKELWKTKNPSPILSWLWVENNSLYLGGGIAGTLGDWPNKSENGMYAYSLVK